MPERLGKADDNSHPDNHRQNIDALPEERRIAPGQIAEDDIDLVMMHLADADDDKAAMGQNLGTAEPAGSVARVTGTKMQHADNQEAQQAGGWRQQPCPDDKPSHRDIERQKPH